MKLSKEELKQKIVDVVGDEDTQIALLEDIEDSFTEDTSNEEMIEKSEYENLKTSYEELKTKYKERFLEGTKKDDQEESEETEELKEENVIDVKEI